MCGIDFTRKNSNYKYYHWKKFHPEYQIPGKLTGKKDKQSMLDLKSEGAFTKQFDFAEECTKCKKMVTIKAGMSMKLHSMYKCPFGPQLRKNGSPCEVCGLVLGNRNNILKHLKLVHPEYVARRKVEMQKSREREQRTCSKCVNVMLRYLLKRHRLQNCEFGPKLKKASGKFGEGRRKVGKKVGRENKQKLEQMAKSSDVGGAVFSDCKIEDSLASESFIGFRHDEIHVERSVKVNKVVKKIADNTAELAITNLSPERSIPARENVIECYGNTPDLLDLD